MNLKSKKKLAARTLKVGVGRIFLDENRKEDLNEAITKQDIKDLKEDGAIKVREIKGKRKKPKRKTKKREGKRRKSLRKKNKKRKDVYVTRKLRKYIINLKNNKKIDKEKYYDLRKKIKSRKFKTLKQLNAHIAKE